MALVRGGFFQISLTACCVLACAAQAQVPRPGGSNKEIPILFPRVEQEELFLQSIEAFDAGQTNRMMQLVDQAVAIDPVNGYAYIKRAQLMDLVGNNQRAAADYTSALTYVGTDPKFADIYQMRGCAFFKLGNLRAAVGDWATFLRMKPEKEAEHWQIGVAYALLGSHEEARKQLEWHWTVNSGDMEVAFWHYLSVARMEGVDQARAALREIDGEERVPMNKLYELYQGKATEGDVWLAVAEGNPDAAEQTRRKFFAHLYLGLHKQAAGQLTAAKAEIRKALDIALEPIRDFMFRQTRTDDILLFLNIAKEEVPETRDEISLRILIPAFILSELTIAFQIGFIIYIPFLIIDMVVASTLMAMGMMMLPPIFVSLPFKIIVFVLADGWRLLIGNLAQSFYP